MSEGGRICRDGIKGDGVCTYIERWMAPSVEILNSRFSAFHPPPSRRSKVSFLGPGWLHFHNFSPRSISFSSFRHVHSISCTLFFIFSTLLILNSPSPSEENCQRKYGPFIDPTMLKKASSFVMSKTHTQRPSEQRPPVPKVPREFLFPPRRPATDTVPSSRRRTRSLGTWESMDLMQQRMQLLERDMIGLRSEKASSFDRRIPPHRKQSSGSRT